MSDGDRSCSTITDSSSSSSSDDDPAPCKTIKRKNRFLDPDFKMHEVSNQTLKKYKQDSLPRQGIPHGTLQANIIEPEFGATGSATDDVDAQTLLIETSSFNEYLHDETLQSDVERNVTTHESICNSDNQNKMYETKFSNNNDNDSSTDGDYDENDESNSSDDSENERDFDSPDHTNDKKDYIFNKLMFETSQFTVRDVIVLSSAFALRYHLPDEARLVLMKMFQLCAGPTFDNLNLSTYLMSECLSSQNEKITYNYYCSKCSEVIVYYVNAAEKRSNKKLICQKCKANNAVTPSSSNYFMSIDLYSQFRQFFSNKENVDDLLKNINARNTSSNIPCDSITDVHDGSIYKSMKCSTVNLGNNLEYMLTLNISTDGAPLTKSGKRAFWPLQVIINDLSPKLRFRYVFLAGLLVVKEEPKAKLMNLYIQAFINKQLNNLNTNRKLTVVDKNGTRIVLKFNILSCVVDSVCRPIVQNRMQFNAYCGCSWCYQLAEFIKAVCGIRYTFHQDSTHRTHESHKADVKLALETKTVQNGVRGISALQELQHFDLVWSYPYEYMHGMLLGVTFQIWKEWKSQECLFKLKKKEIEMIEKRYLNITPTNEIHRLPRSGIFGVGTAKPKASELKSWLLYFSLPCLSGILHDEALKHYSVLVKSAHTLLKANISHNELDECEKDLLKFVCEYEMYYGEKGMTFNVHSLLHVVESIRKTGPLCMNSAFPFESNIYTLKRFINGSKGMDLQIAKKHMQSLIFKSGNVETFSSSEEIGSFCKSMFMPKRLNTFYKEGLENVLYVGRSKWTKINETESCLEYKKCIYKSSVYHSSKYKRPQKTDDTVIQLVTGEYCRIVQILDIQNTCHFRVSLFNIFEDYPFEGVTHIRKIKSEETTNTVIKAINDVKCKVIIADVKNGRYLCTLSNTIEIQ